MKIKPIFYGEIKNGKLELNHPDLFKQYVATLKGEIQLKIQKKSKYRSLKENNYLHGVVLPLLSEQTGYTTAEMKAVIKWLFKIESTAELTTVQFEQKMEEIRRWAAIELSVNIPEPNEYSNFSVQ
jgi:hypothetical protein